ncbi:class I SAM-dependent methyltransferase [Bacteroides graminisolvens]
MDKFDNLAGKWDMDSIHWHRSKAIAEKLATYFPKELINRALEYGAGTGILSFMLADKMKEIVLMDSSSEMIQVCLQKINSANRTHLSALKMNLETETYTEQKFNFIYTQMAMHHVHDTQKVYKQFFDLLESGGLLAVADLYPEDGSFHGDIEFVHKGFDPEVLTRQLTDLGFINITYQPCFTMEKTQNGVKREYPIFLLVANK